MTRVALVGLGLIGEERWRALSALADAGRDVSVVAVLDPDSSRIPTTGRFRPQLCSTLGDVIALKPDWTFVATPHDIAVEQTLHLLRSDLRVLIEKPLGRTLAEAEQLANARSDDDQLWVGHNYRFFRGIELCLRDIAEQAYGELVSVQLVLCHGGAPGMEAEWKLDPERAGGGALIDPGIHLLDLARLIGGPRLSVLGASSWSGFWNTGIEEECHLLLRAPGVPIFSLQASLVRWRSTFRLDVNGTSGYGVVEGRGKSYGKQTYRRGERWGWRNHASQAASEVVVAETDGADVFTRELRTLLYPASSDTLAACSADEALVNMQLLEACRAALTTTDSGS